MVDVQFLNPQPLAGVLTRVVVTFVDVASSELHAVDGQSVVGEEPNNPRHDERETRRLDHIRLGWKLIEFDAKGRDLCPPAKVVADLGAVFDRHRLRDCREELYKRVAHRCRPDRCVTFVEYEYVAVQYVAHGPFYN
jgi:hypothetical protein